MLTTIHEISIIYLIQHVKGMVQLMKILYIEWNGLCANDVKAALKALGHEYKTISTPDENKFERNENFQAAVEMTIKEYAPDLVFSMNFFPSVSMACHTYKIKYISWIYDNPQTAANDYSVKNECNYIFSYDSYMVSQLQSRGVEHIYYAPMAVNAKRIGGMSILPEDVKRYTCDIAMVGSLYNESTDYYSALIAKAHDDYLTGYLEGLLNSQKLVYGYNFMAEALPQDIVEKIRKVMGGLLPEQTLLTEQEIYSDVFLSKKLATINRVELLYMLGTYFDVHFFTYKETFINNITHRGPIDYNTEMPKLFKIAKINLNDTRRSNKCGIPLRAMDIMGCGGFLLSNFQEDFYRHFEPDVHMVMYGSIEEAIDKSDFYLKHDTEREQIKQNAFEIMQRDHTYEIRLRQMFETAGLQPYI